MSNKDGRNDPCSCGSGKKFKKCCGFKLQMQKQRRATLLTKDGVASLFQANTKALTDRIFKVVKQDEKGDLSQHKVVKKEE